MRHTFETEQWLPYPRTAVFSFFADPDNLPRLMPVWQHTRIDRASIAPSPAPDPLPGPQTPAAGAGTTMTLTFRPFPFAPFRISWDAEITEFAWNDHFCDVQHRGPFAFWRHCHHVADELRGGQLGTIVRDHVVYQFPLGPLGDLAQRVAGGAQIRNVFHYRQQRTAQLLAAAEQPGS